MRIFNDLVGGIEGVETEERLTICHNLLLRLAELSDKGKEIDNNNLNLAASLGTSQVEVKKVKKILEQNGFVEIVKVNDLESRLTLTTKGSFYSSKLKADKLKDAMTGTVEAEFETFVNPQMDLDFVDVYNRLSYKERVAYESVVAAILCREQYQSCYFRTLGSLLDSSATVIMPILESLEEKGLITLVGERSTKVYLNNSREFLLTQYGEFYNTGFVKNDYVYKAAFKYEPEKGYAAPYPFPDFEVVYPVEETMEHEEIVPVEEAVAVEVPVVEAPVTKHSRLFLIDTSSVPLDYFIQNTASQVLTEQDYYVAMLSAANLNSPMSFTLFNQLMKLPCRGETDLIEETMIYYQIFTIKIMQMLQENPQATIVVLTNEPTYPMILNQLRIKLNLRDDQVQLMNLMA